MATSDYLIRIFRSKAEYDSRTALVELLTTDKHLMAHPTPASELTRWGQLSSIVRSEAEAVLCQELVTWLESDPDTSEGEVLTAWAASLLQETIQWSSGTPLNEERQNRATAAARLRNEFSFRSFLGEV